MFEGNNKDTRPMSKTSFWCHDCFFSGVSIDNLEQLTVF